jgi:hypothetical protein
MKTSGNVELQKEDFYMDVWAECIWTLQTGEKGSLDQGKWWELDSVKAFSPETDEEVTLKDTEYMVCAMQLTPEFIL